VLLVTVNEKEHWYFYAKDKKKISKIIFLIRREFIALIIHMLVEPLAINSQNYNNMNKEPNKYIGKIDSCYNFFLREPYIPILKTLESTRFKKHIKI